ncbi:sensor histidine kinase [Actinomadura madurae]
MGDHAGQHRDLRGAARPVPTRRAGHGGGADLRIHVRRPRGDEPRADPLRPGPGGQRPHVAAPARRRSGGRPGRRAGSRAPAGDGGGGAPGGRTPPPIADARLGARHAGHGRHGRRPGRLARARAERAGGAGGPRRVLGVSARRRRRGGRPHRLPEYARRGTGQTGHRDGAHRGGAAPGARAAAHAIIGAAREALRNVAAHSGVVWAEVRVERRADEVAVSIVDWGRGFDPALVPAGRYGLGYSIRERMALVGGTVEVESAPGQGTAVTLRWSGV